jgi:hypothetical protein
MPIARNLPLRLAEPNTTQEHFAITAVSKANSPITPWLNTKISMTAALAYENKYAKKIGDVT